MAEFQQDIGQLQPQASPVAPVVDTSTASAIQGVGNILGGIGEALFGTRAQQAQLRIQKQNQNSSVAAFEQQQLKVAQAVDQGKISSAEGRMRMRQNYYSALSNYQGDPNELLSAQQGIISNAGLGKVVAEGTDAEKQQKAFVQRAFDAGWVTPNMSSDDQQVAAYKYQQFQQAQQALNAEKSQYELQSAKLGVTRQQLGIQEARQSLATGAISQQTARIGLAQKQREYNSQTAIGNIQDAYNYKFQQDLTGIQQRYEQSAKTPQDQAKAIQEINMQLANVQQQVAGIGGSAGQQYIDNVITPMKMRAAAMTDMLSGKIDGSVLDQRIHNAEAVQKNLLLGDPSVASLVAQSSLLRNVTGDVSMAVDRTVVDRTNQILQKNGLSGGKPSPGVIAGDQQDQQVATNYFNHLKVGMAKHSAGMLADHDATTEEINSNLNNTLKGVKAYGGSVESASELNQVVDFLASPQFGNYVSSNKASLNADAASSAKSIIQEQYENVVLPLVQDEWTSSTTTGSKLNPDGSIPASASAYGRAPQATSQAIVPQFVGSGLVFNASNPNDPTAKAKAADLNKKVAPVVNRMVRMYSHLEGNTDYRSMYDKAFARLFESPQQGNADGSNGP